jgi:RNA polymerase sigma factor (sigma-70 family)
VRTASIPAGFTSPAFYSKRVLSFAGDAKLVEQIRRGNEAAFEVAFARHGAGILGFCRHMLASPEEAEDVVQHTFAAAFGELQRGGERDLALKPWLYTIARNRCVSVLRSRREHATEEVEVATTGLTEEVERRAELRELLRDLLDLPDEQREAILLAEVGDLSHAEVAKVLGCEVGKVKGLVFRARSGLIQRRTARETSCSEIREQLANLRGGSLRRSSLRHHLRWCEGCRAYREQVKHQRRMLASALPVAPSLALKSSVLGAVGLGGGSAGGGLAAGLAGMGAGASSLGGATVAKVALVGVLAAGGAAVGKSALDESQPQRGPDSPAAVAAPDGPAATPAEVSKRSSRSSAHPERRAVGAPLAGARPQRRHRAQPLTLDMPAERGNAGRAPTNRARRKKDGRPHGRLKAKVPPGHLVANPGRGRGPAEAGVRGTGRGPVETPRAADSNGRGAVDAPPAETPIQRGPPEPPPRVQRATEAKPAPPAEAAPPAGRGADRNASPQPTPPTLKPEKAPKE